MYHCMYVYTNIYALFACEPTSIFSFKQIRYLHVLRIKCDMKKLNHFPGFVRFPLNVGKNC